MLQAKCFTRRIRCYILVVTVLKNVFCYTWALIGNKTVMDILGSYPHSQNHKCVTGSYYFQCSCRDVYKISRLSKSPRDFTKSKGARQLHILFSTKQLALHLLGKPSRGNLTKYFNMSPSAFILTSVRCSVKPN